MTARRQRAWALAACTLGAASLLAACSSPGGPAPARSSPSQVPPSPAAGLASPSPRAAAGLLPAPRGVTDRLIVRQARLRAGPPLKVTLLVTYRGRTRINLNRGCRPHYAVVLTNRQFPPDVAFAADCSAQPFFIRPGENRLRVTVLTTYRGCTRSPGQATRLLPACQHGPRGLPPPLPAGRYTLVLVGAGLPLPAPAPVPVMLSPAS
jgi:hypothetical protein